MIRGLAEKYTQQEIENMTLYFMLATSGSCLCPEEMPRKLTPEEVKRFGFRPLRS